MHYFLGTLALLGMGLIGLLIETHKQDKNLLKVFQELNDNQANTIANQRIEIIKLVANQKPVPWNKGKKYTLPRGVDGKPLRKQMTTGATSIETRYVLDDEKTIIAAWDKDGNQTVFPKWDNGGNINV